MGFNSGFKGLTFNFTYARTIDVTETTQPYQEDKPEDK